MDLRHVDEEGNLHLAHTVMETLVTLLIVILRIVNARMGYVEVQVSAVHACSKFVSLVFNLGNFRGYWGRHGHGMPYHGVRKKGPRKNGPRKIGPLGKNGHGKKVHPKMKKAEKNVHIKAERSCTY